MGINSISSPTAISIEPVEITNKEGAVSTHHASWGWWGENWKVPIYVSFVESVDQVVQFVEEKHWADFRLIVTPDGRVAMMRGDELPNEIAYGKSIRHETEELGLIEGDVEFVKDNTNSEYRARYALLGACAAGIPAASLPKVLPTYANPATAWAPRFLGWWGLVISVGIATSGAAAGYQIATRSSHLNASELELIERAFEKAAELRAQL